MDYVCLTMDKTNSFRFPLALAKTFIIMHMGFFTQAQVLQVKNGVFKDITNVCTPSITGGIVQGDALVFGAASGSGIYLPDAGRVNFKGGFTLKAKVYFETTPNYQFSMKFGSYSTSFMSGGKITSNWMTFASEPIFTNKSGQYNYYPVGTELLNGYATLPLKQWVDLEYSYDEALGKTVTKINGVIDRVLDRYRGAETVSNMSGQPLRFFEGATNLRVREISFTTGRPVSTPTMNIQANGLPYRNQFLVTIDQIDPNLRLPQLVYVYAFRPGAAAVLYTFNINDTKRIDTTFPMPVWNGQPMTVQVKVAGIERNFEIVNRAAPSPFVGTKFPIVAYHAKPEDFRRLAKMGFSIIQNDFNVMGDGGAPAANIQRALDSAKVLDLGIYVVAKSGSIKQSYVTQFKNNPNLYGWYLADEPGGADLLEVTREDNNAVKLIDEKRPTMVMMNNFNRLTGLDCDIIGVDPFALPNISLRMIDDAVKAGIRAAKGTKPVFVLFPHYNTQVPNLAELKCMSWIGIIAGAYGIGIFEWDHRSLSTPKGYYVGDNPAQVAIVGTVFSEVRSYDWLLSAKNVDCQTGNLAIHACTKTVNGKTYLLLANDSRKAESATFVAGGKTVAIALAPYEVKIQELTQFSSMGGRMAITNENSLKGDWENDQWLTYRINFKTAGIKNSGTITLKDALSEHLVLSKMELIGSSHPLQFSIKDENKNEIELLISENAHSLAAGPEMKSSGYVEFRIPVKTETRPGTQIVNQVNLFSGSEFEIQTNQTLHVYQPEEKEESASENLNKSLNQNWKFSAYPNPGTDFMTIESKEAGQLEIIDITGRGQLFDIFTGSNQLPITQLKTGLYLLRFNGQTIKWQKS